MQAAEGRWEGAMVVGHVGGLLQWLGWAAACGRRAGCRWAGGKEEMVGRAAERGALCPCGGSALWSGNGAQRIALCLCTTRFQIPTVSRWGGLCTPQQLRRTRECRQ